MRTLGPLIVMAAASGPLSAQEAVELPLTLQTRVDAAAQACADFKNGSFAMAAGAVVRTDLDGDLRPDWVLNEQYFHCSTAASLYGSTGGTLSHFLVGERVFSLLNQGWEMRVLGRHRVLLAEVHGTQCGAYGYTACITASVWDPEFSTWRSALADWED